MYKTIKEYIQENYPEKSRDDGYFDNITKKR